MLKRVAVIVASLLCMSVTAKAADLGGGGYPVSGGYGRAATFDVIEIYDGQDPYYVRDSWREPWFGRHFFPAAEQPVRVGRAERIPSANRTLPPQAESYFRYWSTPPGYDEEFRWRRAPRTEDMPINPPQK